MPSAMRSLRQSRLLEHAGELWARYALRRCKRVGNGSRVRGTIWVHGDGGVFLGDRVFLDARTAPIELYARPGAVIVIGDDCTIESGTSIDATASIVVGASCRISAFCTVLDNHFHSLTGERHLVPAPRPVVLEDDVWLGPHATVLAGAHAERGLRVGARAVLRRRAMPVASGTYRIEAQGPPHGHATTQGRPVEST